MRKNMGFSLVELIIVIAIMAILVGVMAPQLIKYVEKTNVSSDYQLCDSVKKAMILTISDPELLASTDSNVKSTLASLADTRCIDESLGVHDDNTNQRFDGITPAPEVQETMKEILGFDVFDADEQQAQMKSTPAKTNGMICYHANGSGQIIVFIAHSDSTGKGRDLFPGDDITALTEEIYVD